MVAERSLTSIWPLLLVYQQPMKFRANTPFHYERKNSGPLSLTLGISLSGSNETGSETGSEAGSETGSRTVRGDQVRTWG